MTTDNPATSEVSPDEAFALLADETRLEILRTLSEVDDPLSFSVLFERSDYDDSSNFSYHLGKLEGHFITRTDEGYAIRQTGRRVVEAVIAGTVTENPLVERAPTDSPCPFCGAPIEVSYEQERVEMYCSECAGALRHEDPRDQFATDDERFGHLGSMSLPPAGVRGRSPPEILEAAQAWKHLDVMADSAGFCSRCSGVIEHSVTVCEDHDGTEGICGHCGRRYAVLFEVECGTCHYNKRGIAPTCLLAKTELLSFLTGHGGNPLVPETFDVDPGAVANYEEDVLSVDPFRAAFTFTIGDDSITLTVDEDVSVVDVERGRASNST
jgi:DNA-binding transcriptional ArsR family regulator